MVQTRGTGSSRTGHLRLQAPSRLHTAVLWAPEQSYGRLGPAVQPWGCLSEAPAESPALAASIGQ